MTPTLTDADLAKMLREWDRETGTSLSPNATDAEVIGAFPRVGSGMRLAYELALSRTVDREREAAKRAIDHMGAQPRSESPRDWTEARDRYLARIYPVTPEPVVLSDGSTVTLSDSKHYFVVRGLNAPPRTWRVDQWRHIATTGADFDKLKALAATLTEPRHA